MWPFKKKTQSLLQSGIFQGMTDWHSHILPGVDDGIKTMEESLEVLGYFEKLGIKKVWLTPHIMEDYPNETAFLRERFDMLKQAWKGNVEISLAAENMLDSLFDERLEKGDFLPIGEDGNHLLVETSYYTPPMDFNGLLEKIKAKGYYPILAHPERYRYMEEEDYKRLKEMGIKFQINLMSLVGGYGETARKKAEWLLRQGFINYKGSDLHKLESFEIMMNQNPQKQHADSLKTIS